MDLARADGSATIAGELDIGESVNPRGEEAADDGRGFVFDDNGGAGNTGTRPQIAASLGSAIAAQSSGGRLAPFITIQLPFSWTHASRGCRRDCERVLGLISSEPERSRCLCRSLVGCGGRIRVTRWLWLFRSSAAISQHCGNRECQRGAEPREPRSIHFLSLHDVFLNRGGGQRFPVLASSREQGVHVPANRTQRFRVLFQEGLRQRVLVRREIALLWRRCRQNQSILARNGPGKVFVSG
jgi:hypothetical protein